MLNFVIQNLGDTALFRCGGRFVSGDSEWLRSAVLNQTHARTIVLDLAAIASIDAAGIGMLVALRTSAQARGVGFKLMNLTPRVEAVLELTKLRDAFEVCSLREMLELLCKAIRQSPQHTAIADEGSRELSDYSVSEDRRTSSNAAA